jgi:hypothetical protein
MFRCAGAKSLAAGPPLHGSPVILMCRYKGERMVYLASVVRNYNDQEA